MTEPDLAHTDLRTSGPHRRELFLRFYAFHLKYRSHPGGVYYVLPHLADALGWDEEQRAWAAWVNGNTQNPVTTLMLLTAGPDPRRPDALLNFYMEHRDTLPWDTDRRYHRKAFLDATLAYLDATGRAGGQAAYWRRASAGGWDAQWAAATALPTMGRLSAWSYLEYLRILRVGEVTDADTLMVADKSGSKSHRNGLLLVDGQDDRMWWRRNPDYRPDYTPDDYRHLEGVGASLLADARARTGNHPDAGYLTLESALCTFKSWHLPNRRYAGVYNDMLHDRIRLAETRFGHRFDVLWDARAAALPDYLRLEATPGDPGCVPVKQNHFLDTGRPVTLGHEYPDLWSDFDDGVAAGRYRKERKTW